MQKGIYSFINQNIIERTNVVVKSILNELKLCDDYIYIRKYDKPVSHEVFKLANMELRKYGLLVYHNTQQRYIKVLIPKKIISRSSYEKKSWIGKLLYLGGIQDEGYLIE